MRTFGAALIDVDGTLRDESGFKPGALALLDALAAARVPVALCSGRTVGSLRRTASDLPMVTHVAGGSGSAAQRRTPHGWVDIGERHLSDAVVASVLARGRAAGMEVWLYTASDWFVEDDATPMVRQDSSMTLVHPTVLPLDQVAGVIKMLIFETSPAQRAVIEGLRSDPSMTVVSSYPGYYDVVHAESAATKGGDFVLGDLGVAWADAIAIGDGENDLGMLSRAGVALCMPPLTPYALTHAALGQARFACPDLDAALGHLRALGLPA